MVRSAAQGFDFPAGKIGKGGISEGGFQIADFGGKGGITTEAQRDGMTELQ